MNTDRECGAGRVGNIEIPKEGQKKKRKVNLESGTRERDQRKPWAGKIHIWFAKKQKGPAFKTLSSVLFTQNPKTNTHTAKKGKGKNGVEPISGSGFENKKITSDLGGGGVKVT